MTGQALFRFDLGVVALDNPVRMDEYGVLPELGAIDDLATARGSFGLNANCAGIGGDYRVDQPDDLDWLNSEFGDLIGG